MAFKIAARTIDHPHLSNITRDRKCTVMNCRGDEENGFEYLCSFKHRGTPDGLRVWIPAEYIEIN